MPAAEPLLPLYLDSIRMPMVWTAAVHDAAISLYWSGCSASALCQCILSDSVHAGAWPLGVRNGRPLPLAVSGCGEERT